MSAAQGGKRPRPQAKASAAKPKATARAKGGAAAKPRTKSAAAKAKARRRKKAAPGLWTRLKELPRLAWLAGLCLTLGGVVLVWWWSSLSAVPNSEAPRPAAGVSKPRQSVAQPQPAPAPAKPPAQLPATQREHGPDPGASAKVQLSPTPPAPAPSATAAAPSSPPPAPPAPAAPVKPQPAPPVPSKEPPPAVSPPPPPAPGDGQAQKRTVLPMPEAPPYEEHQPGAPDQARLKAVDEAIFAGLRQGGLEPAQIHIKLNGGPQEEITLLEARLRAGQDLKAVARALDQGLRKSQAKGAWRNQAGGALITVTLGQEVTHRVSLLTSPPPKAPPAPTPLPLPPGGRPRVAIVIDDMGYQVEQARRLLALDLHLTLSILPYAPHARETADLARQRGALVMAHLPMEPRTYPALNPGPGALLVSMDSEALRRATLQALQALPGVAGANNHMGSRFSEEPASLQPVMEVLRQQGLFFLDSVTSPRSQARDLARRMGLAHGQRDVFLDHEPTAAAITQQVLRLIKLAKAQGRAVAIGHPHATTIAVLTSLAPRLKQEVELVPVNQLLTPPGQGELDSQAAKP